MNICSWHHRPSLQVDPFMVHSSNHVGVINDPNFHQFPESTPAWKFQPNRWWFGGSRGGFACNVSAGDSAEVSFCEGRRGWILCGRVFWMAKCIQLQNLKYSFAVYFHMFLSLKGMFACAFLAELWIRNGACILDVDPPTARYILSYNFEPAVSAVFPETKTELRIVTVWVSMQTLDAWMSFQTLQCICMYLPWCDKIIQNQKVRPVAVVHFQCQMCLEDGTSGLDVGWKGWGLKSWHTRRVPHYQEWILKTATPLSFLFLSYCG